VAQAWAAIQETASPSPSTLAGEEGPPGPGGGVAQEKAAGPNPPSGP
jgi:hypothetical protein